MARTTPSRCRPRIRPMSFHDLSRVVAVEAACFGADAWPRQVFADLLRAFRQSRPTRGGLWVAEKPGGGEILGYAGVEVSALRGEMDLINIAVAPAYRRQGVGCVLMELIIRLCRRFGVPLLWLRVRASNRVAQQFYRHLGFQPRGRFDGYYQNPDEPAILMAMDLNQNGSEAMKPESVRLPSFPASRRPRRNCWLGSRGEGERWAE